MITITKRRAEYKTHGASLQVKIETTRLKSSLLQKCVAYYSRTQCVHERFCTAIITVVLVFSGLELCRAKLDF